MKTEKNVAPLRLAAIGLLVLAYAGFCIAQTSVPNGISVPVIPAGKAGPPGAQGPLPRSTATEFDLTVAEIVSRPQDYANRQVAVSSEVDEVFTPWAFTLDEDQLAAGGIDNDLLVVSAEPLMTMGFDSSWVNRKVRVIGALRILQAEDFQREYGHGVDDKLFRRYEGKPALIATSMTLLE